MTLKPLFLQNSSFTMSFDFIFEDVLKLIIIFLSGIKKFENEINPEYEKFRIRQEKTSITIKSKLAINGLYSNIVPYIKQEEEEELYPTAGEGRKKLLSYSIFDLLANETIENKIIIFLIEEPENHLHKSMQIALSKIRTAW